MWSWARTFVKSRTSAGLRRALRGVSMEVRIQRLHRAGLKRAREFAQVRPLRLNLGSGFRPRRGWVNVDLSDGADLSLDLRERLPFGDGTVDAIYTEHFFEHLNYPNLGDSTIVAIASQEVTLRGPAGTKVLKLHPNLDKIIVGTQAPGTTGARGGP